MLVLGHEEQLVEQEDVPASPSSPDPKRPFGYQLPQRCQVRTGPPVQLRLDLLDPDGMLVLALHGVDLTGHARHGGQRQVDRRLVVLVALFRQPLELGQQI